MIPLQPANALAVRTNARIAVEIGTAGNDALRGQLNNAVLDLTG